MKRTQILLTVTLILFATCPALLIGAMLGWQSSLGQVNQVRSIQLRIVQLVSAKISSMFQEAESQLRLIGQVMNRTDLTQDQQSSVLSSLLSQESLFEEIILLDNRGQEQLHLFRQDTAPVTSSADWSNTDEFIVPKTRGEVYYSPVTIDEETVEPVVVISMPFSDAASNNVLVAKFRFINVWWLIDTIRLDEGVDIYIVDGQNRVVAYPDPAIVLKGTEFNIPEQDGEQVGLNGNNVVLETDEIKLGEQKLIVVSEQSVSKIWSEVFRMVFILGVTVGLCRA